MEDLEEKHEKAHDGMDVMADSHCLAPGVWRQSVPELEAVAFGWGLMPFHNVRNVDGD